eukprot:scaffold20880_cov174-Amphora_coffeaeformis.AAC.8
MSTSTAPPQVKRVLKGLANIAAIVVILCFVSQAIFSSGEAELSTQARRHDKDGLRAHEEGGYMRLSVEDTTADHAQELQIVSSKKESNILAEKPTAPLRFVDKKNEIRALGMTKSSKSKGKIGKSGKSGGKGSKDSILLPQCVELTPAPVKGKGMVNTKYNTKTSKGGKRRRKSKRKKRKLEEQGYSNNTEDEEEVEEDEEEDDEDYEEDADLDDAKDAQESATLRYLKMSSKKKIKNNKRKKKSKLNVFDKSGKSGSKGKSGKGSKGFELVPVSQ